MIWMLLPLPCKRLTVSLDEPDGFLAAVGQRLKQLAV